MLQVRNVHKEFILHVQGNKQITSFRDISFDVSQGQFLAIVGPSGIGKSSLLKCIYRTYRTSHGDIWYQAKDGRKINLAYADDHEIIQLRKQEMGYISQFFHVIPRISTIELITDGLVTRGYGRAAALEKAEKYLTRVRIPSSLWDMYPSTFSGGEKQRINIIQALITEPRLLLLDEPTASLDPLTKQEVITLIQELKQKGTAMIGIFHDYETIEQLADIQYDLGPKSKWNEEVML
jgi:alpha-D-ribose 1-methylphosphonate 5-triphosphate synthase subunit PhnL